MRESVCVWVLSGDGVVLYRDAQPERVVVPLPSWLSAGAPYGCLPDVALGPRGEVVITGDVVPWLWRIQPDTLAVTVHPLQLDADADKDLGFTRLLYSSRHGAYFASSAMHGSVWRIDSLLTKAEKISAEERVAAP